MGDELGGLACLCTSALSANLPCGLITFNHAVGYGEYELMLFRVSLLTATVVASAFGTQAFAVEQLDEVVVTASRTEQPISEVIGSVTVITRDEIEKRQAQSLQELLRGELGIDITNQGGQGKISNIFMRGANSNQTLILLDGQRLDSASDGATRIEFIPVNQIERIEIVRGPRSSLYGSDAIGGVIQIFTRKNDGISASISTGSNATHGLSAGYGQENDDFRLMLNGTYLQSNGIDSKKSSSEPDRDSYKNKSMNGKIGYKFGQFADIEIKTLYTTGYTKFDGWSPNEETKFIINTPNLKLRINPNDFISITATSESASNKNETFTDGTYEYKFNTTKKNSSVQIDITKDQIQFALGLDHNKDTLDSDTLYTSTERNSRGLFEQLTFSGDHFIINQSLRLDNIDTVGSHDTYNLGYKWFSPDHSTSFNAGFGQGFHAPTFNDLYYPAGYGYEPNPNLKPERSKSIELGLSGSHLGIDWSFQAYRTMVQDLIDGYYYHIDTDTYSPENISKARLEGAELSITKHTDRVSTSLNYTLQNPKTLEEGSNYNNNLIRRARQSGRFSISYSLDHAQVSSNINIIGPRFANISNTIRMGGYTTVDLLGTIPLRSGFSVDVKITNAFDHQYETIKSYNQEGRGFYLTLRYQPKK